MPKVNKAFCFDAVLWKSILNKWHWKKIDNIEAYNLSKKIPTVIYIDRTVTFEIIHSKMNF